MYTSLHYLQWQINKYPKAHYYTRRGLPDRFFFAKIDRAGRAEYMFNTSTTKGLPRASDAEMVKALVAGVEDEEA